MNSLLSPPKKVREVLKPFVPKFLRNKILQVKNEDLAKSPMKESTREGLKDYFSDEIEELEKITDKNFENWKT